MKSILLKTILLFGVAAILLLPIAWKFNSGYIDPFYTRFTTDETPSMIIGISRAAQGLLPQEFRELAPEMQNFAFTIGHSPFGPAYLDLIKEKLDEDSNNGLFLVAVNPWALSLIYPEEKEGDLGTFREHGRFTTGINLINMNPNFEYIIRYYDQGPLYKVFSQQPDYFVLHKDGWLEVTSPLDTANLQEHINNRVKVYKRHASIGAISPTRMEALKETVSYLKEHGRVYLVRLPVGPEMVAIKDEFAPEFDADMQKLADAFSVPYINYFEDSGKYQTTDGNHLYKEAGRAVSKRLALDIKTIAQKPL